MLDNFDLVKVWKFGEAPAHLRRWHSGASDPEWLALIPASIHGPDLDDAIREQSGVDLGTYQTETGDFVYTGSSRLDLILVAFDDALAKRDS